MLRIDDRVPVSIQSVRVRQDVTCLAELTVQQIERGRRFQVEVGSYVLGFDCHFSTRRLNK